MAEVFLDRSQRDASGGERGGEGVAQVVEPDLANADLPARRLESTRHLCAIERHSKLRMGENEVVLLAEHGAQPPLPKLAGEAVRHRHRALRAEVRLALARVLIA